MSEFSDYMEDKIIDDILVGSFVALFDAITGLEADNPTGEIVGNGYTRKAAGLNAASGGHTENAGDVTFPTASGDQGTITHTALVDHETNTNWGTDVHVLMFSPLDVPKDVGNGDTFKINAGDLDVDVT